MRILAAITAVCLLLPAHSAHAKAYYMGLAEAVAVSDVIAVIEVTGSTKLWGIFGDLPKRGYWKYRQKNTFRFRSFLKNPGTVRLDAKAVQTLYAQKTFVCASASYAPGKYLVFLESVGENEWITLNHARGGLKIDGAGNVERFGIYEPARDYGKATPLPQARKAIAAVTLDGKSVSCMADVAGGRGPRFNRWLAGEPSQKLIFGVREAPRENWPEGLSHFARGFVKADVLNRKQHTKITLYGAKCAITGTWTKGAFLITSIEKK